MIRYFPKYGLIFLSLCFVSSAAGRPSWAAEPCACDCDGDGSVAGNELTLARQVLRGLRDASECRAFPADTPESRLLPTCLPALLEGCPPSPPPECPCDCNRDGTVTGNEITLGINIVAGEVDRNECRSLDLCDNRRLWPAPGCGTLCINLVATGCPGEE